MEDCDFGQITARLCHLIEFVDTCDNYDSFLCAFNNLYRFHRPRWRISGEERRILETRENSLVRGGTQHDLVKMEHTRTGSTIYNLVVPDKNRVLSSVELVPRKVPYINNLFSAKKKHGYMSHLVDEILIDCPEAVFHGSFSQEGFIFMIKYSGFSDAKEFYLWVHEKQYFV